MQARSSRPGAGADAYHHGNLRQALLEQAVELARAGGPDAVALRDVQRRAGVSNSAAYRHYADRDALLAAVTEYAEERLADTIIAALDAVPKRGRPARRAVARFRASGQAYIEFALAEPGLFRTVFAPGPARERDVSEAHPFQILIGCIDDLVATGELSADRRAGLDAAAWAAVHGLAVLFLDGPLAVLDSAGKQQIANRLLDVFQDGLN